MRRAAATTLAAAMLLAGCGGAPESTSPTFGGGPAPEVDDVALADAAQAAGIRDCPEPAPAAAEGPEALPALSLACIGGDGEVDLATLQGPAVINLWASWCRPCREELPLLARLDDELGDEVQLLGIDVADPAPEAALELAQDSGVTYPQVLDPDQDTRAPLRVAGLPQTVFVDADGRVAATERRPYSSYDDLLDAVEEHLGVRPS